MKNTDDTKGRLALWISASLFAIFVANLFVAGIVPLLVGWIFRTRNGAARG